MLFIVTLGLSEDVNACLVLLGRAPLLVERALLGALANVDSESQHLVP